MGWYLKEVLSLNFTEYSFFTILFESHNNSGGVERAYIKKPILKVKRQTLKKKGGELMGSDLLKSQIEL